MSVTSSIYESYVQEAIHAMSTWEIDDDQLPDAINAQARIMAGCCSDTPWFFAPSPYGLEISSF